MDTLASIPGPWFLLLYAGLIAAAAWFASRWSVPVGTTDAPDPDALTPAELGFLRDGPRGAVAVTLFRLVERGQVVMAGDPVDRLLPRPAAQGEDGWGRTVLDLIPPEGCGASAVFAEARRAARLGEMAEETRRRLRTAGLLRDPAQQQSGWLLTLAVAGTVAGIGAAKLALGLAHGRPVAFLVILLLLAVPAVLLAARPWRRRTAAGEAFLARAAAHFRRWLPRTPPPTPADAPLQSPRSGPDPAFAVAACGVAALALAPGWSPLESAIRPPPGSGGGCGSGGCGGIGAEAGCSGDGGGSDGGGGCGGCGGD
jgi:uncharacterized protein (TIGR04222 family)